MSDATGPPAKDAPEQPDPMLGTTLGERYRIESLVARGGMARVYRARDERLDRDVAVKVLSPPYADDRQFTERFLAEGRAAASITHPSLVHVYDSGSDGAAHFIVMELLVEHRSLRQELDADGPLARDEVLRIGRELLAGLRVVHDRGLVHCDVKSGNVMRGPGPAKLIDFGIARPPGEEIDSETSIGSLAYMAPEQLHGEALTPASDLFSLGVVLYEALTGRLPFAGDTPAEVSAAHVAGSVRPPSTLAEGIPGRLDAAILQSLRRDPDARFRSAEAMTAALGAAEAEMSAARDDETHVAPVARIDPPARRAGYVPPPVPPPDVSRRRVEREPARSPRPARPARSSGIWGLLGTMLVLLAAAAVVLLVVVPLLNLGQGGGGPGSTTGATAAPTAAPGTVTVPNTVGRPTDEAIGMAREAGLNWIVRCAHDESSPEGIIDQEPPAGTPVAPGSTFTMYSARISDCPS